MSYPSRQRVWGTRFDTLSLNSPSTSPPSSPSVVDDTPPNEGGGDVSATEPASLHSQARLPQDGSIFVGSLPGHIDDGTLVHQLSNHLSIHEQIRNLKVVRDSKGGVCAFIQCDDASSAARLIEELQKEPRRQFLGRYLRYEPARALRTLLISYRTPLAISASGTAASAPSLPRAIRLCSTPGSKHITIFFDDEARTIRPSTLPQERQDQGDAFANEGLLIDDMQYDAKMMHDIASAFGALEQFESVANDDHLANGGSWSDEAVGAYTPPREIGNYWRVKWERRDDAVAALMTLRRLPFIGIRWAHHTNGQHEQRLRTRDTPTFSQSALRSDHRERAMPPPRAPGGLLTPSSSFGAAYIPVNVEPPIVNNTTNDFEGPLIDHRAVVDPAMPASLWGDIPQTSRAFDTSQTPERHGHFKFSELPTPQPSTETLSASTAPPSISVNQRYPLPDLSHSPITPRTPTSAIPFTPADHVQPLPIDDTSLMTSSSRDDALLDHFSVFVGGLDAIHWDEPRLRVLFEQYGGIENVRLLKPAHQKTAFAYIKFAGMEGPRKAVAAEHNQLYNGRPIRVQIRSLNPPAHNRKNGFAHGTRGRGGRPGRISGGSPRTGLGLEVSPSDAHQGDAGLCGEIGTAEDDPASSGAPSSMAPARVVSQSAPTIMNASTAASTDDLPPPTAMPLQPGWTMQHQPVMYPYPVHYTPLPPPHRGPMLAHPLPHMMLNEAHMAPRAWTPVIYGQMPYVPHAGMGTPPMLQAATSAAGPGPVRPSYPMHAMMPMYPYPMSAGPPMHHGSHQAPHAPVYPQHMSGPVMYGHSRPSFAGPPPSAVDGQTAGPSMG